MIERSFDTEQRKPYLYDKLHGMEQQIEEPNGENNNIPIWYSDGKDEEKGDGFDKTGSQVSNNMVFFF